MQSSSAARYASVLIVAAFVLPLIPVPLAPDALARTVPLPAPVLTSLVSVSSVEADAQTLPPSNAPAATQNKKAPAAASPANARASSKTYPRLVIPALGLNDPIVDVGVDSTGAMAVPSGNTNEVGWYDGGVAPGGVGSAVLDAHVFAAFSKLKDVQAGDDIYVETSATVTLHFVVTKTETYALSQITSQDLFVPTSDHDLNLITCAGQLTPDHSTYTERLVVYSTLVK